MKLMSFLFGKKPDIFNKKGQVEHQMKTKSWEEWKNRYKEGREYDWTQHSGLKPQTEKEQDKSQERSQRIG